MTEKSNLTRRNFIKTTGAAAAAGIISALPAVARENSSQRPNVVFIICDQMRGDAMGCMGNPNARTPNLDQLAKDGILFENAFANGPVCVPSRISIFSGQYPHQHGTLTNKPAKFIDKIDGSLLQHFHDHGYKIGWIGKNHTLTDSLINSLDTWIERKRESFRRYNKYVPPWWHSDMLWPTEECNAPRNTRDSIEFIKQCKSDQPFFLHISYFDPHPAYFAPSEYVSKYCSRDIQLPEYVPPENLSERLAEHARAMHFDRIRDSDLTETMRYYHASVEWGVDHQVGRVIEALKEQGLMDNTIVVFTSDHGDFMGQHRMVRKGEYLYDALLHVPMIWYAPGYIESGLRVPNLAQGVDIFPTLVDLAGGAPDENLSGRSLKPFLTGEPREEPEYTIFASTAYSELPPNYFEDPEPFIPPKEEDPFHSRVQNLVSRPKQRCAMARTRDWKLILNENRPPELYHMNGGWIERKNVADNKEFAAIRGKLENRIRETWAW
ncbi:MAG: sulfatase-like hydrolase/transferase [candidate division KSB1 bacterium]|nr:sulfatase-like hydrolase/transferase [candidate division KSB1 bacterium]